jgi:biopolymer transport protein ExbD
MRIDAESKAYDDINVTPMVDLYLVLLLIFIIMTTAGLQGL